MHFIEPKTPKNQGLHHEHGGVMIMIFVMIALFAALSYMMSRGTSTGTQSISEQQARLQSVEILTAGRNVKEAVQALLIDGCETADLNFNHTSFAAQENVSAPADGSCDVFSTDGGNVRPASAAYINVIDDVGTTAPEIYHYIPNIANETCDALNNEIGNGFDLDNLPELDLSATPFTGDTAPAGALQFGDDPDEDGIQAMNEACVVDTDCSGSDPCNAYYKILVVQ